MVRGSVRRVYRLTSEKEGEVRLSGYIEVNKVMYFPIELILIHYKLTFSNHSFSLRISVLL
jgi:hypothetical protein